MLKLVVRLPERNQSTGCTFVGEIGLLGIENGWIDD